MPTSWSKIAGAIDGDAVDDGEHRRRDDVVVARLARRLVVEVERVGLADGERVLLDLLAPDRVRGLGNVLPTAFVSIATARDYSTCTPPAKTTSTTCSGSPGAWSTSSSGGGPPRASSGSSSAAASPRTRTSSKRGAPARGAASRPRRPPASPSASARPGPPARGRATRRRGPRYGRRATPEQPRRGLDVVRAEEQQRLALVPDLDVAAVEHHPVARRPRTRGGVARTLTWSSAIK